MLQLCKAPSKYFKLSNYQLFDYSDFRLSQWRWSRNRVYHRQRVFFSVEWTGLWLLERSKWGMRLLLTERGRLLCNPKTGIWTEQMNQRYKIELFWWAWSRAVPIGTAFPRLLSKLFVFCAWMTWNGACRAQKKAEYAGRARRTPWGRRLLQQWRSKCMSWLCFACCNLSCPRWRRTGRYWRSLNKKGDTRCMRQNSQ